ncbi:MAG: DUF4091 domain-containing protein [Holophagae bacterium]|nr:DUF4091 domain-containing protein [Holophagae bacterium]
MEYAFYEFSDELKGGRGRRRRFSSFVQKVAPELKVLGFKSKDPGNDEELDITIFGHNSYRVPSVVEKEMGREHWSYVAVSPKPLATGGKVTNYFLDEVGINHRFHFWQVWEMDAAGILYWGINQWQFGPRGNIPAGSDKRWPDIEWVGNVFPDASGDGYLVYPGRNGKPWASMRLAIMRDGLEDYEYFLLLDTLIEKSRESENSQFKEWGEHAEALRVSLVHTIENDYDDRSEIMIKTFRSKIGNMLEMGFLLSVHLPVVDS